MSNLGALIFGGIWCQKSALSDSTAPRAAGLVAEDEGGMLLASAA